MDNDDETVSFFGKKLYQADLSLCGGYTYLPYDVLCGILNADQKQEFTIIGLSEYDEQMAYKEPEFILANGIPFKVIINGGIFLEHYTGEKK